MCGIFGAVDLKNFFAPADADQFIGLTDLVAYRGPDSSGYKRLQVKPTTSSRSNLWDVFLGHRRLSIIDLSETGAQPMTDGIGRWLVFNGEIFNFIELRRELEGLGHHFRSSTDSEVILHIYARYGVEGFSRLNGMWAFALVDVPAHRLILSRDRFSMKPLYYAQSGSRIYFASEIKQLLPILPSIRLSRPTMTAFLAQHLLDHTPQTFFEGVQRVAAKSSLIISLDDGSMRSHHYWNYELETVGSYEDCAERFRFLFEDSVRIRLRSDVKTGCLLSGGLDSSAIAVMCQQLGASNTETFSVISDDKRFSEEEFIDKVSAYTGVSNHKLAFSCPNLLAALSVVLAHNDEPVVSFSVAAQYNLFRLIKQQTDVTVLLSGQGADEILLGYSKFFFFYLKALLGQGRVLRAVKELIASLVQGTILHQFRISEARRYVPWLNATPYGGALNLGPGDLPVPIWQTRDLRQRQISDIDFYSVPALTHYEDRNSMAHSLEVRNPFLDHRLVNFVISLPEAFKIRNGWTKYILRESIHELPHAVRWRKDKKGFVTAEEKWIRNDLRELVRSVFQKSVLAQLGILDDRKFIAYHEKVLSGTTAHFGDISRALIAELWACSMFGGKNTPLVVPNRELRPGWGLVHSN